MSLENGLIKEQKSNMVLVESEANAACSSCAAKSRCISDAEGQKRHLWIENTIGAKPGDHVIFQIEGKSVVFSSVLLYLIPAVGLITGLIIGSKYSHILDMEKDMSSAVWGFCGLVLSFLFVKIVSDLIKKYRIFLPTLIGIDKVKPH